ncbi:hypothetical protein FO519_004362 [Halicephalobus sp. NKZ332]|nr:hypothetical protein FO519_004362 [Halicephalobus sp. NKZ332]
MSSDPRFPDSIMQYIFRVAPSSTCLKLAETCHHYRKLKKEERGCPVKKATFKGHGNSFKFLEEEPFEISFQCGSGCFSVDCCLEALKNMNFDGCELTLVDMSESQIQKMISSVRSIFPSFLRFQNCELDLKSFEHLSKKKVISGMHITGTRIYPPPDFKYILKKTKFAHFICLQIENMEIPEDATFKLLCEWDRRVELEGCKIYNMPKTVTLEDYINFIRKYSSETTKRITFVFSKDVGAEHLKENIHFLEFAEEVRAEIGFCIEQNERLNFLPIFMFLRMKMDPNSITRYGVTATF